MKVNELKERYVYASTRRLPNKVRKDIALELETLIDDMLLERCGNNQPEERDLRVIFAEIGQPSEIHRKYSPKAEHVLIGPPYYEPYVFILKLVSLCTIGGITLSFVISMLNQNQKSLEVIIGLLTSLAASMCGIFTFITILFAFFSRKGVDLKDFDDEINSLQPVPKTNLKVSRFESIVGIIMCVIFSVLLLCFPNIIAIYSKIDGIKSVTPFFNNEVLYSMTWAILLISACGITRESVALLEGNYNKKLLITTIITNIVSFVLFVFIINRKNLFNQEIFTRLIVEGNLNDFVKMLMNQIPTAFSIIFLIALLIDTGETIYKFIKNN